MGSILLVEDDLSVAASIDKVTSMKAETRHVTCIKDAIAAVRLPGTSWDAAIVDVCLGDGSGLDLAARLAGEPFRLPVLLMTGLDDRRLANDATAIGVQLAFKPLGVREIESFLSRARAELPAARVDAVFDALAVRSGLSAREREIVRLVLDGARAKDIPSLVDVEPSTSKSQVRSLLTKCGADDLGSLVRKIQAAAMERLPVAPVPPSSAWSRATPPAPPPRPGLWRRHRLTRLVGGGWVLVVDDVPEYARSYARLLQRWVTCEIACSVEEALALATRPGLVGALIDVRLGRADGIDDIATPLRRTYPGVDIRIISGANAWEPDVARAARAGFSYILKDGNLEPLKEIGPIWSRLADRVHVEGTAESDVIGARLAQVQAGGVLTPLQVQALGFAVRGLSRDEIAARLGTTPPAVDRIAARMRDSTGKSLVEWADEVCAGSSRMLRLNR